MTELTPLVPLAGIPGRRWAAPPLSPDKYDPDTLERLIRYLESRVIDIPLFKNASSLNLCSKTSKLYT